MAETCTSYLLILSKFLIELEALYNAIEVVRLIKIALMSEFNSKASIKRQISRSFNKKYGCKTGRLHKTMQLLQLGENTRGHVPISQSKEFFTLRPILTI